MTGSIVEWNVEESTNQFPLFPLEEIVNKNPSDIVKSVEKKKLIVLLVCVDSIGQ